MLELRHVSKSFAGIPAVSDVSFTARPGEVTGYLGPNGSGKSTTMKMITGLIEMTDGEVLFDGQRIQADPIAYKQRMGYVPEEPHLYPHLTGLEYLTMVAQLRNLPERRAAERIDGLLKRFHLHILKRYKKNGTPIKAVNIPIGTSVINIVLDILSINKRKDAPKHTVAGKSLLWSGPTKIRLI